MRREGPFGSMQFMVIEWVWKPSEAKVMFSLSLSAVFKSRPFYMAEKCTGLNVDDVHVVPAPYPNLTCPH